MHFRKRGSGPTAELETPQPGLTHSTGYDPMQQATLPLPPPAGTRQPTAARETFRAAYAMARRMVRQHPGHSTGDALTWFFDHAFRRFGYAAVPVVRAAGWAVFHQRHVTKA